jgi:hypothetical protein
VQRDFQADSVRPIATKRHQVSEGFDYIVIFGAAVGPDGQPSAVLRRRVEHAHRIAEGRSDVRYLVTGGLGRHPPKEAEAIVSESEGHDTLSSAILRARILRSHTDVRSVTLCSSSFHLLRCRLLFRTLGMRTTRARLPSVRAFLGPRRGLRACLREVPAIPWDLTLAGWHRLASRHVPQRFGVME